VFDTEAEAICRILLDAKTVSPLLNLGSSTRQFREVTQPHIERRLFTPLKSAGIDVFHSDLKHADGVDLAGDILDPVVTRELKARGFRCVLLSHLLEHVRDRGAVAAVCEDIVGPGGLVLATVPSSYPFHADPIDTYYRPSPADLASVFTRCQVLVAEELAGRTYAEELRAKGSTLLREIGRTVVAASISFAWPRSFLSKAHRWLWYSRNYRVSIVLLEVRS
jgi:hypothetical protein